MAIKVTVPNNSSDSVTFGSANTAVAAEVVGIDSGSSAGQLAFKTTASGTSTERMRINASGNVGVGTSNPSQKLDVNGGIISRAGPEDPAISWFGDIATATWTTKLGGYNLTFLSDYSSGNLGTGTLSTNSTTYYPKILFTNTGGASFAGNVLVGRTSTGFDKTAYGWQFSKDAESFGTINTAQAVLTLNRNNTGDIFKFFRDGTQRGYISVEATGTTFGNLSDRRVKENFTEAPEALSKINAVKVQSFDWKEGGHTDYGFVAQDLHRILPFVVTPGDDGETVEKAWGIDNAKIVPVLVKAMQELKDIIDRQAEQIQALQGAK